MQFYFNSYAQYIVHYVDNYTTYWISKEVSKLDRIYTKENFIIIPVGNSFLVINMEKIFKEGHTCVKNIGIARLLIDLAIDKELPKNPYFVDNLIKIISDSDKKYIKKLQAFKSNEYISENNYKELMKSPSYRRHKGALQQVT